MEITVCTVCCKNKTAMKCDDCASASCKHCSYFIDEGVFDFPSLLPEKMRDKAFCPNCYNENICEDLEAFQETLERARNVNVYLNDQGSETRLIRRIEKPVCVEECEGREETQLRLAFLTAQKGYDTMVDVDLRSQKVSMSGKYKRLLWSGTAVPVDPKRRK